MCFYVFLCFFSYLCVGVWIRYCLCLCRGVFLYFYFCFLFLLAWFETYCNTAERKTKPFSACLPVYFANKNIRSSLSALAEQRTPKAQYTVGVTAYVAEVKCTIVEYSIDFSHSTPSPLSKTPSEKRDTLSRLLQEPPLDKGSVVVYVWRQVLHRSIAGFCDGTAL